ncbi:hypothetical protein [Streptomyces uncialis]|uniref:hypothetical protein n=1 Tax=Streptomyces uncialis TaxID=1048205 RepID=UPI0038668A9D|nr:hypothetical protein OG924_24970 [Streptomyces uncialis]
MHARFQGLSAFYTAPEAEQLFATTGPVKSESDVFADQLESVTTALSEYAAEVRPIEARLKQLKADATAFVSGISGDKHWKDDGDKVEENNDLVKDVNAAVAAFWEAERACANKITALVCGTHFIADDGTGKSNMYGFSEKDLDGTKELPWGSQVEESRRWWEVHHHVGSFLKGVFVDGLWGTIRGLGTLVGVDGWDAAGQAWTGLAKVVTGLAITVTPVLGTVFWTLPEEKLPGWFRESRTAVKETGKALVAWDEWGKNPARAAGATTFNVVTTVFTGGAGAAAKTGSVAKVISALGKTGRLLDPVTYIAKGGKVVTVKVGDLLAGLRNVDAGARINIPEPATPAPVAGADDAARAGTGPDPSHTVRLPDDANGSPQYLDTNTGQLLDAAGNPKPDVMPRDVTNPDRSGAEVPPVRSETPVQVGAREPALVGAGPGAGTIDNAAGGGAPGGVTPGAGTPGGTPGGVTPGGGAVPGAVTPGGGAVPGGGGLDGLPGGGANNLPGGGAGQLPGGGAGQLPGGAVDNLPGGGANNLPGGGAGQLPGGAVDNLPGGGANNLPGGGANHIPGGTADNLPSNNLGDNTTPGGGAATTPDTTPGGGTAGDSPTVPGQGADPVPGNAGGGTGNGPGGGGGNGPGGGAGNNLPEPRDPMTYTPAERQAIMDHQVARANDPSDTYFKDFYQKNGYRKDAEAPDEFGLVPPQLLKGPNGWFPADRVPHALPPSYLDSAPVERGAQHATPEARAQLNDLARERRQAIADDRVPHQNHTDASRALKRDSENVILKEELLRAQEAHRGPHARLTDASEAYGEGIARHHAIPERYPGAAEQKLHGPKSGNHQFDQVYKQGDRYIVVEAKSHVDTALGSRRIDNVRHPQGSRKYFTDILREMQERSGDKALAKELAAALKEGRVDYVLVKGLDNNGSYAGYAMREFDIRS